MSESKSVSAKELLTHLEWVRSLARALVSDPARAEDVEQETWAYALERPPRHGENVRGWLARVARNAARQIGRSETARRDREGRDRERWSARSVGASSSELVAQAELHRDVVDRVLQLEEGVRSVLILRYFRGHGPREIATELGVPLNTVRSRLRGGLAQLREGLDREHGHERWARALVPAVVRGSVPWGVAAFRCALGVGAASVVGWVVLPLAFGTDAARRSVELVGETPAHVAAAGAAASNAATGANSVRTSTVGFASTPAASMTDTGTLEILCVDAASGAPVADLEFCVFGERGGDRLFHAGRTDSAGRALVEGLPEDTILVQTARRAPHAPGLRGVWLAEGERERVVFNLGCGGSARGRVVDDRGVPVAGHEVHTRVHHRIDLETGSFAKNSFRYERVAQSDADGRFVVDHLASLARGVWIVDGQEKPERHSAPILRFRHPQFGAWGEKRITAKLGEDGSLDLGDIEVPRPVSFAGRVLGEEGHPLEGVLVGAHPDRRWRILRGLRGENHELGVPPWDPTFHLIPGEALSDAGGYFRIVRPFTQRDMRYVMIWAPGGHPDEALLPEIAPGEEQAGVELVVSDRPSLEITLRGTAGVQVASSDFNAIGTGDYRMLGITGRVRARIAFADGTLFEQTDIPHAGGVLRMGLPQAFDQVRVLEVVAPGYLPARVARPSGLVQGKIEVKLAPKPELLVRVVNPAGVEVPSRSRFNIQVSACLLSPAERAARGWGASDCCGLGDRRATPWKAPLDLALQVQTNEPYWVYVAGRSKVYALDRVPAGPFAAGERRYEVTVSVVEVPVEEPQVHPHSHGADPVARSLDSLGYGSAEAPCEEQPFGLQLLSSAGRPLSAGTRVSFSGPGPVRASTDVTGESGRIQVTLDSDPAAVGVLGELVLVVHETQRSAERLAGRQRLRVTEVPTDGSARATLDAWQDVEVLVRGLDPSRRDASLVLRAYFAEGDDAWGGVGSEVPHLSADERRFRFRLGRGEYELRKSRGIHALAPQRIEVEDSKQLQRFEIYVR